VRFEVHQTGFCEPQFEVIDTEQDSDDEFLARFKYMKHALAFAGFLNGLEDQEFSGHE
jgi:hypothetical protein